jgi:1-deoxy-D-xylulose-5-phosphate reductoisomerase
VALPDRFVVRGLVARQSGETLRGQIAAHAPSVVGFDGPADALGALPLGTETMSSSAAMAALARDDQTDILVVASSGHAAITATLDALKQGKVVALANKEAVVCAGPLVIEAMLAGGGEVRPVDSEHSAIWQSLGASDGRDVRRLTLTASGGPFRTWSREQMRDVSAAQALNHPTWRMGGKITIDSATLVNKGLELIEARWLFGVEPAILDVVVHPESIIHSLVEFADYSQVAQLSLPDMRLPIQFALTWPEHAPSPCRPLSLAELGQLTFEAPDEDRFPGLRLAREAMIAGSTFPTVYSAADEVAVKAFLAGRIGFTGIADAIAAALDAHVPVGSFSLDAIEEADHWAREMVAARVARAG